MISRAIYPKRAGRRFITGLAAFSLVAGTLLVASGAVALSNAWELDRNATSTLTSTHLGGLKGNVSSTATSFVVCELSNPLTDVNGNTVTFPATIQIDAEQMTLTSIDNHSSSTGGCSFANPNDVAVDVATFHVTRDPAQEAAHIGGTPRNDVTLIQSASGNDWNQVYSAPVSGGLRDCSGISAVACIWKNRPNSGTATAANDYTGPTTFTGTSGDTNPISSWTWTNQSVPAADEINDAFAVKYANSTAQDLYMGMDRYAVNGSKDVGFWFFHQAVSPNPDGSFSGAHCYAGQTTDGCDAPARGDLLLLSTFSQGGGVTEIRAYEWVGDGPGAATSSDGPLNYLGSFGDCADGFDASTPGCATTANTTVPAPWTHQEKPNGASADTFYAGGFMEGGIDLTDLGITGCFASFMGTSRASPSLTAQPKAFILGGFEACNSSMETTPSAGQNGSVAIGSNGTVSVTDQVTTLDVTGASTWSGDLNFYLCGPLTTGSCDGTTNVGTQVGTTQSISNTTTIPITSPSATISSANSGGSYYCWRAEFKSSTTGVPDASDGTSTECFTVTPLTPTIGTQVKNAAGDGDVSPSTPLPLGTTVYDTASLSGGTTNAGGTVRYRVYTDSNCSTALTGTAGDAYNSQTDKAVTNGVAAQSDSITLPVGTYYFQATYQTGDANNVAGALSTCTSEAVTIQATPAPQSGPQVQIRDSVTVTGLSTTPAPTGNLVVGIYTEPTCTTRLTDSGGTDIPEATIPITSTWPQYTSYVSVPAGTYYFKLSYAGDDYNAGFTDCTENVDVTSITPLPTP